MKHVLGVRQLLIAALSAAGSLLASLPAIAQLSTDTTTFSGEIAASCSFSIPESISLSFRSPPNDLYASQDFEISTNSPAITLNISQVTVNKEPSGTLILPQITIFWVSGNTIYMAAGSKEMSGSLGPISLSTLNPTPMNISASVGTNSLKNGIYSLPIGEYSYTTTFTCLL